MTETYTYTIYDGDPSTSGPCAWPDHEEMHFEADDFDDAVAAVREELAFAADGLDPEDYAIGDHLWANVWSSDGEVRTLSHEIQAEDLEQPTAPIGEVSWEITDGYVACLYGIDGDEPGDCYTRIGQDLAGFWWVDDGDEYVRADTYGPYASEAEAKDSAAELAADQDESVEGEDADAMRERMLRERAGEPDPDGEWSVYWETVGDDGHAVERYATRDAAEARATLANDGLHAQHHGDLLCGYSVRQMRAGEWIRCDDD